MTVEKIILEEHALARTLDKVNREIAMTVAGSKRRARLQAEKTGLEIKHKRRVRGRPDR